MLDQLSNGWWLMVLRWAGLVVRGLGSKGGVVVGGLTAMLTMAKAVLESVIAWNSISMASMSRRWHCSWVICTMLLCVGFIAWWHSRKSSISWCNASLVPQICLSCQRSSDFVMKLMEWMCLSSRNLTLLASKRKRFSQTHCHASVAVTMVWATAWFPCNDFCYKMWCNCQQWGFCQCSQCFIESCCGEPGTMKTYWTPQENNCKVWIQGNDYLEQSKGLTTCGIHAWHLALDMHAMQGTAPQMHSFCCWLGIDWHWLRVLTPEIDGSCWALPSDDFSYCANFFN